MDNSNYFYKDIASFGSYPSQNDINDLEKLGFRLFLNLTSKDENLPEYKTNYLYLHFPIKDRTIPEDNFKFTKLILYLEEFLKNQNGKMYIHCRGGHGRSAMIAGCLLSKIEKIDFYQVIEKISKSHQSRKNLNPKYKYQMCPNSRSQRYFIKTMFQPLYFSKNFKNSEKNGFSTYSPHKVKIPGLGEFPNSENAYQALKNPSDNSYLYELKNNKNPKVSKILGNQYSDFKEDEKIYYMKQILMYKFIQNEEILHKLLRTGFRPIINHNKYDNFWGDNGDGTGKNNLGILLMNVRDEYLKNK
jgi:ribA/ribD-fused uncharacterized protein